MNNSPTGHLATVFTDNQITPLLAMESKKISFLFTWPGQLLDVLGQNAASDLEFFNQLVKIQDGIKQYITMLIRSEPILILLIILFILLALVPSVITASWCCNYRKHSPNDAAQSEINAEYWQRDLSPIIFDESLPATLKSRKKYAFIAMCLVFIMLTLCILSIFYGHRHLDSAIQLAPMVWKTALLDIKNFVGEAHHQIVLKLDQGYFNVAIENVIKDLKDIDVLLGEPIQNQIVLETNLSSAYNFLKDFIKTNTELIYLIVMLQETAGRCLQLSKEATIQLADQHIQLTTLQRQCSVRDQSFCESFQLSLLINKGAALNDILRMIQNDTNLTRFKLLDENLIKNENNNHNLLEELNTIQIIFDKLPLQIKQNTKFQQNYILQQLDNLRHQTNINTEMLSAVLTAVEQRLSNIDNSFRHLMSWFIDSGLNLMPKIDLYRILSQLCVITLTGIVGFLLVSFCILTLASKTHFRIAEHSVSMAVVLMCLASIAITGYGLLSLAMGGHAHVFLCRQKLTSNSSHNLKDIQVSAAYNHYLLDVAVGNNSYDNDQHDSFQVPEILGQLFDQPDNIYSHQLNSGIIAKLLRPPDVNYSLVNISLISALRRCWHGESSYDVFGLNAFVNVPRIQEFPQYSSLLTALETDLISGHFFLNPIHNLKRILNNRLNMPFLNFTAYRQGIRKTTINKDLNIFVSQMKQIERQLHEENTISRLQLLIKRTERLNAAIFQPLEVLQNEIIEQMSAVEFQHQIWLKQLNRSLAQFNSIDKYLSENVDAICNNYTLMFTARLKAHLDRSKETGNPLVSCRPLYDIFERSWFFVCHHLIDFINVMWFYLLLTLFLWSVGTPFILHLVSVQRRLNSLEALKISMEIAQKKRQKSSVRGQQNQELSISTSPTNQDTITNYLPNKTRKVQIDSSDFTDEKDILYNNRNLEQQKWLNEFEKVTSNQRKQQFDSNISNSLVYLAPKPDTKGISTLPRTPAPLRNRVTLTARAMDEIARFQPPRSLNSQISSAVGSDFRYLVKSQGKPETECSMLLHRPRIPIPPPAPPPPPPPPPTHSVFNMAANPSASTTATTLSAKRSTTRRY